LCCAASVLFLAAGLFARFVVEESVFMLKRITQDPSAGKASADPIFIQGTVEIQNLVSDEDAKLLRVTSVSFHQGARNRPHRHTCDQVLIATHGSGFIATDEEELKLQPGDVILVPENTRHWHGAVPEADFTHISILTPSVMSLAD
jgi:quercetin dioxygenase-like cupin family protein